MKSFLSLALAGAASAFQVQQAFVGYIAEFGKHYETVEEFNHRLEQFSRNHVHVLEHNAKESNFMLGHNKMSDWTEFEYKSLLNYIPDMDDENNAEFEIFEEDENATGIDWRSHGAVNAIKDQGQCGSCWAFSAVSAMESAHHKATGKLLSFAEQQLVDCSTRNHGCNGGNAGLAFNYYKTDAAMAESSYKYTARDQRCSYNAKNTTGVKDQSYSNVTRNSSSQMKSALQKAPLSVAIEADRSVFQSYRSGIFNSSSCGTNLDHATNVVGWGSSSGTDYWIMRNSWGTSWGEKGYMRLAITSGAGICGIQSSPLYPTTN
jgi:C1A family cysteine protease